MCFQPESSSQMFMKKHHLTLSFQSTYLRNGPSRADITPCTDLASIGYQLLSFFLEYVHFQMKAIAGLSD